MVTFLVNHELLVYILYRLLLVACLTQMAPVVPSCYYFTAVGVGVRFSVTPITKGPPAQFFWGVACFLFPRGQLQ